MSSNDRDIRAALIGMFRAIDGPSESYESAFARVWPAPPAADPSESGTHLILREELDDRSEITLHRTAGELHMVWVVFHQCGDSETSADAIDKGAADMERALAKNPTLGIPGVIRARITRVGKNRGTELDGGAFALVNIAVQYRFDNGNP